MMLLFLNSIKKVLASVFAILIMVTGSINSFFNGDVYAYESEYAVVGIETLTRAQDVTTDGESYIFSGRSSLEKVSLDCEEIIALNAKAIPTELSENYGSAHIGGISYANGLIYAALEDSKVWQHPIIALYDAYTLEFTGEFHEMPAELFTRGIPWVIADGENGVLYAGDSANFGEIYAFDMNSYEHISTITLSEAVPEIQGGEIAEGILYVGTNDMTRAVYTVNVRTGEVTKLFDRIMYEYKLIDNFGGEGEGLTLLEADDGTYIHTLQIGAMFVDSTLRNYKLP